MSEKSDELDGGKIEDSILMPLGLSIRNAKKKQIEDLRDKKICTYCGTGYRGNIAADELVKEGFNAVNFGRRLFFMGINLKFFIHSKLLGF